MNVATNQAVDRSPSCRRGMNGVADEPAIATARAQRWAEYSSAGPRHATVGQSVAEPEEAFSMLSSGGSSEGVVRHRWRRQSEALNLEQTLVVSFASLVGTLTASGLLLDTCGIPGQFESAPGGAFALSMTPPRGPGVVMAVERHPPWPSEERTSIEREMVEARVSTAGRHAYAAFERAFRVVETHETATLLEPLSCYLADPDAPYKTTLLGCMADREIVLEAGPLLDAVSALLLAANLDLARSAALAMAVAGERATTALRVALDGLPQERRRDLNQFLTFAAD